MQKEKSRDQAPPPITVPICDSFSAEQGVPIIFTDAPAGAEITQSGNTWPFCGPNNQPFGPPIVFPLPANIPIYIKDGLTPGNTYCYNVVNAGCAGHKRTCVTVGASARVRKSA
jgi:hypothetical protein